MTDPSLYLPPGACRYYLAAAWLVRWFGADVSKATAPPRNQ